MKITEKYLRQVILEEVDLYEGAVDLRQAFLQKQQGGDQTSAAETSTGGAAPEGDTKTLPDVWKMMQYIDKVDNLNEYGRLLTQVIHHAKNVSNSKMLLMQARKELDAVLKEL